jgi:hypothetical protein
VVEGTIDLNNPGYVVVKLYVFKYNKKLVLPSTGI